MRAHGIVWFVALLCCQPAAWSAQDTTWQVGVAKVEITPRQPMWMAGYAARNEPCSEAQQKLWAKCLWLRDGQGHDAVFVTCDLIGIPATLRADVTRQLEERIRLSPSAICLNASHTHCGPELREQKLLAYGVPAEYAAASREYVRWLTATMVTLVESSRETLQAGSLRWSFARAAFAMNRRLPTPQGVINSPYPAGPVNHRVPVLQALDGKGELRAVLFGYACHNTTLSFQKWCGDYAGYAQQYLEESHPGVTALFLAGCGADQNPYPRRTLQLAQAHGRALANAVETALETRWQREIDGPLAARLGDVQLEFQPPPDRGELERRLDSTNRYERVHARRLLDQLKVHGKIATQYEFPLQVVQFGDDLTLVAVCGETVVDYALRFQRELIPSAASDVQQPNDPAAAAPSSADPDGSDAPIIWVAGYSNHVFGYLPSLRVLREGGYEGGGAMRYTDYPGPFADSVEQRVVERVRALTAAARAAVGEVTSSAPPAR